MTGMGVEVGVQSARSRALAVLHVRSRALAVALLPAAPGEQDHGEGGRTEVHP
ncbi:hypothetical protein ABT314_40990 [Streptomyces spiralis]